MATEKKARRFTNLDAMDLNALLAEPSATPVTDAVVANESPAAGFDVAAHVDRVAREKEKELFAHVFPKRHGPDEVALTPAEKRHWNKAKAQYRSMVEKAAREWVGRTDAKFGVRAAAAVKDKAAGGEQSLMAEATRLQKIKAIADDPSRPAQERARAGAAFTAGLSRFRALEAAAGGGKLDAKTLKSVLDHVAEAWDALGTEKQAAYEGGYEKFQQDHVPKMLALIRPASLADTLFGPTGPAVAGRAGAGPDFAQLDTYLAPPPGSGGHGPPAQRGSQGVVHGFKIDPKTGQAVAVAEPGGAGTAPVAAGMLPSLSGLTRAGGPARAPGRLPPPPVRGAADIKAVLDLFPQGRRVPIAGDFAGSPAPGAMPSLAAVTAAVPMSGPAPPPSLPAVVGATGPGPDAEAPLKALIALLDQIGGRNMPAFLPAGSLWDQRQPGDGVLPRF